MKSHGWFVTKAAVECGLVAGEDESHLWFDADGKVHASGPAIKCGCEEVPSFIGITAALDTCDEWCLSMRFGNKAAAEADGVADLVDAWKYTEFVRHSLARSTPTLVDWQLGFLKQFVFTYSLPSASQPLVRAAVEVQQFLDSNPQIKQLMVSGVANTYKEYWRRFGPATWANFAQTLAVDPEVLEPNSAKFSYVWAKVHPTDVSSGVFALLNTVPGFTDRFSGACVGRLSLQAAVISMNSSLMNRRWDFIALDEEVKPHELEFLLKNPSGSLYDASKLLSAYRATAT